MSETSTNLTAHLPARVTSCFRRIFASSSTGSNRATCRPTENRVAGSTPSPTSEAPPSERSTTRQTEGGWAPPRSTATPATRTRRCRRLSSICHSHRPATTILDVLSGRQRRRSQQLLREAQRRERYQRHENDGEPADLGGDVGEVAVLEGDAADDAQEVGEGQDLREVLGGTRHPLEGEHEAGEQDVRQQKEHRHLHGLLLGPG